MYRLYFLTLTQERVGGLEAGVRDKHKLEVKVQSLQEVCTAAPFCKKHLDTNWLDTNCPPPPPSLLLSLPQENSRLGSQVAAQESLLEGLRGERQLWSRELAQQGAELAQDRGRMEAQIEALSLETASLREELQVHTCMCTADFSTLQLCAPLSLSPPPPPPPPASQRLGEDQGKDCSGPAGLHIAAARGPGGEGEGGARGEAGLGAGAAVTAAAAGGGD